MRATEKARELLDKYPGVISFRRSYRASLADARLLPPTFLERPRERGLRKRGCGARFASERTRERRVAPRLHLGEVTTRIDRSFFPRADGNAPSSCCCCSTTSSSSSSSPPPPLSSLDRGGRPVTYHSRRIKIHRGSDDSGVKIHRNATATRAHTFTRVSRALRHSGARGWVDRLDSGRERDDHRKETSPKKRENSDKEGEIRREEGSRS